MEPETFNTADFQDILRASYLPQRKAEELMAKKGYGYDKDLSTMSSKVFVSPTGQPIISNRGSVRLSDWLVDDVNIALGSPFKTQRIKDAEKLSKETQLKYGLPPTHASHSLGGYLSERAAQKTPGSQTYTYNKAASFPSAFYSTPKSQTDFRTSLDIPSALSAFQSGGSHKTLSGSWSPFESHDLKYLEI